MESIDADKSLPTELITETREKRSVFHRSTSLPLSHYRSRHHRSEPLPLESLPLQIFQILKFLKIHLLKLIYVMFRLD